MAGCAETEGYATEGWVWPQGMKAWRRAADAASALLMIEAVQNPRAGAVRIDRERCEAVLERARERGIVPRPNALGQYVATRAALGSPPDPDSDLRGLPPR